MTPAGQTAFVRVDGQRKALTVHAWDDDGHPMVVGVRGLARAEDHLGPDAMWSIDDYGDCLADVSGELSEIRDRLR